MEIFIFEIQNARYQTTNSGKWKIFFCDVQALEFLFRSINDKPISIHTINTAGLFIWRFWQVVRIRYV